MNDRVNERIHEWQGWLWGRIIGGYELALPSYHVLFRFIPFSKLVLAESEALFTLHTKVLRHIGCCGPAPQRLVSSLSARTLLCLAMPRPPAKVQTLWGPGDGFAGARGDPPAGPRGSTPREHGRVARPARWASRPTGPAVRGGRYSENNNVVLHITTGGKAARDLAENVRFLGNACLHLRSLAWPQGGFRSQSPRSSTARWGLAPPLPPGLASPRTASPCP